MRSLRAFYPAILLLAGCAFIWHSQEQVAVPLAAPLSTVLPVVDGYRTQNQTIGAEERRVAGMSDYVARIYWRDSVAAFTTYVGYYDRQTQGRTIHSPRNCLPGAGWEILSTGTRDVMGGGVKHAVNRNVLKNGTATAVVYYWYQGRGRVVANEYRVKWDLLRDAAVLGHTEEALVRLVVPMPAEKDPADAAATAAVYRRIDAFADSIATRLMEDVSRVLPGTSTRALASTG